MSAVNNGLRRSGVAEMRQAQGFLCSHIYMSYIQIMVAVMGFPALNFTD